MLDPDVSWQRYTATGVTVGTGSDAVVAAVRRGQGTRVLARRVSVNGEPGILAWSPTGRPLSVMACVVDGGGWSGSCRSSIRNGWLGCHCRSRPLTISLAA